WRPLSEFAGAVTRTRTSTSTAPIKHHRTPPRPGRCPVAATAIVLGHLFDGITELHPPGRDLGRRRVCSCFFTPVYQVVRGCLRPSMNVVRVVRRRRNGGVRVIAATDPAAAAVASLLGVLRPFCPLAGNGLPAGSVTLVELTDRPVLLDGPPTAQGRVLQLAGLA